MFDALKMIFLNDEYIIFLPKPVLEFIKVCLEKNVIQNVRETFSLPGIFYGQKCPRKTFQCSSEVLPLPPNKTEFKVANRLIIMWAVHRQRRR